MRPITSLIVAASLALAPAALADTVVVDFESGAEGWTGPQGPGGVTTIDPANGNPGANMHTVFSNFGIAFKNSSPEFAQDLTQHDSVTLSVDLKVESIDFFGAPVTRPWFVEIRDFDNAEPYPWVSVWYLFDWVGTADWTTWSVTIDDTSSVDLPAGWGGYGAEDPKTFEPILPEGRTFADVLAGADEIAFSTLLPGFFFGETQFNVRLDNITIITEMAGDVNGDEVVNFADILAIIGQWGFCPGCSGDLDGDNQVGFSDILIVIGNWS
jgi:hypothetical protein